LPYLEKKKEHFRNTPKIGKKGGRFKLKKKKKKKGREADHSFFRKRRVEEGRRGYVRLGQPSTGGKDEAKGGSFATAPAKNLIWFFRKKKEIGVESSC